MSGQLADLLYLHNWPSPGSGAVVMVDVISSSLAVLPLFPSRGQARGSQGVSSRRRRLAECGESKAQRLISIGWNVWVMCGESKYDTNDPVGQPAETGVSNFPKSLKVLQNITSSFCEHMLSEYNTREHNTLTV